MVCAARTRSGSPTHEALAVADADLPVYTVLVPAYREPEVIARVDRAPSVPSTTRPTDSTSACCSRPTTRRRSPPPGPASKDCRSASSSCRRPSLAPSRRPATSVCRRAPGELVTIFDAEDRPEPLQLRRAVVALRRLGDDYACVQARLGYFNVGQNLITRWFTHRVRVPGSGSCFPAWCRSRAPIPLGGTSNHFRTDAAARVGAGTPFNVTEDADLGHPAGPPAATASVCSTRSPTEEANSDFVNWVKQRSRWYKGYLQTWLVHMRRPVERAPRLGWRGALGLHLFVCGTPLTALINPVFWALTLVWFVATARHGSQQLFPRAVFYVGAVLLPHRQRRGRLHEPADDSDHGPARPAGRGRCSSPLYWVMMSAAAAKAAFQLVCTPFYWEKTSHGLNEVPARLTPSRPRDGRADHDAAASVTGASRPTGGRTPPSAVSNLRTAGPLPRLLGALPGRGGVDGEPEHSLRRRDESGGQRLLRPVQPGSRTCPRSGSSGTRCRPWCSCRSYRSDPWRPG